MKGVARQNESFGLAFGPRGEFFIVEKKVGD